jgi:hypothetical protein
MKNQQAFPNPQRTDMTGMTMQQYAAIKLKVPDSGIDWLDEMIIKSLRNEFAAKALQGICASGPDTDWTDYRLAAEAYDLADAMLEVRGQA